MDEFTSPGLVIIAALITCIAVLLRQVARLQTPEDTSLCCGKSRLGTVCKLSHLLGFKMPLVEATR